MLIFTFLCIKTLVSKETKSISLHIISEAANRKGHEVKVRCLRYIHNKKKALEKGFVPIFQVG